VANLGQRPRIVLRQRRYLITSLPQDEFVAVANVEQRPRIVLRRRRCLITSLGQRPRTREVRITSAESAIHFLGEFDA
jgi:hypothetical protein